MTSTRKKMIRKDPVNLENLWRFKMNIPVTRWLVNHCPEICDDIIAKIVGIVINLIGHIYLMIKLL